MPADRLLTSTSDILDAVRDLTRGSEDLRVAVAFWGSGALEACAFDRRPRGVAAPRVICNLQSGACSPDEIAALSKRCRVRSLPTLHAKVWLGDAHMIVGSANASANGLGYTGAEASHWHEAAVIVDDSIALQHARKWFDHRWSNASRIRNSDIAAARTRWPRRRALVDWMIEPPYSMNLVELASRVPQVLRDRALFVVGVEEPMSHDARVALDRARLESGSDIDAYEGWPGMPKDAILISWKRTPRSFEFEGVFRTPSHAAWRRRQRPAGHGRIYLVEDVTREYRSQLGDLRTWSRALRAEQLRRSSFDFCVPFVDFVSRHWAEGINTIADHADTTG